MKLIIQHNNEGELIKFSNRGLRVTQNLIANAVVAEFSDFVREQKLSGQVLNEVTGATKETTRFRKNKNGEYQLTLGVFGRFNFIGRKATKRPFLGDAAREFESSGHVQRIAERVLQGVIRKGGIN